MPASDRRVSVYRYGDLQHLPESNRMSSSRAMQARICCPIANIRTAASDKRFIDIDCMSQRAPALKTPSAHGEIAVGHAEIQSEYGMTSDQKTAEEILERMSMALTQHSRRFESGTADNVICAAGWQAAHNDWITWGTDDLECGLCGKSQIYRCIGLIERGFG